MDTPKFEYQCDDPDCMCQVWFAEKKDQEIERLRADYTLAVDAAEAFRKQRDRERERAERLKGLLTAAVNALRSYQYGNGAPDLAQSVADEIVAALVNEENEE